MRLLFNTNDRLPSLRPDVSILFGEEAAQLGLITDLWGQRADVGTAYTSEWAGGKLLASRRTGKPFVDQIFRFIDGLKVFSFDVTDYDALQVRDRPLMACFWILKAKLNRLPFFYWMSFPDDVGCLLRVEHASFFKKILLYVKSHFLKCILYKVVMVQSDHCFVQSELLKRRLVDTYHLPAEKLSAIPMGVNLDVKLAPSVKRSIPTMVYLGSLDAERRIDVLIDMLSLLRQEIPSIKLMLIGDTTHFPPRRYLEEYAASKNVTDAIEWTGWLPVKEAWQQCQTAHVALSIVPPVFDFSSPTKVLDYMALGIPVVANEEIEDQAMVVSSSKAGLIVPCEPNSFAKAVKKILADASLQASMAKAGPAYIKQHRDYRLLTLKLISLYQGLLGKN